MPDIEDRLRELEEQFDEQRFQIESLQQQLDTERAARQAALDAAIPQMMRPPGYVVGTDTALFASWNNGVELRSRNRDFYFHVGGRTQLDSVWMTAPNNSLAGAGGFGAQDAVDFRRLRMRFEGTMYDVMDWCVEVNMVSFFNNPVGPPLTGINQTTGVFATPAFTDIWWNFHELPVLNNVTLGNIKEPFGLERLESSRFLDFMERSFEQDAFNAPSNNGFAPGILTWNYADNRRWTYATGLFKNVQYTPYAFGVADGGYAVDGRFTFLPYYDEPSGGRYLIHIGMGSSWRGNVDNVVRYRARDALRNGPDGLTAILANTGFFNSQNQGILSPEAAIVLGPWLFQAEFTGWSESVAVACRTGDVVCPLAVTGRASAAIADPTNTSMFCMAYLRRGWRCEPAPPPLETSQLVPQSPLSILAPQPA
jgi:phosphate-selective porin OprO and OprP